MNVEYLAPDQVSPDNIYGPAGVSNAENDVIELSCNNKTVELIYSPEPVDVRIINIAGAVISQKAEMTKGIVAENLTAGVYLVSVSGASLKKLYKIIL